MMTYNNRKGIKIQTQILSIVGKGMTKKEAIMADVVMISNKRISFPGDAPAFKKEQIEL